MHCADIHHPDEVGAHFTGRDISDTLSIRRETVEQTGAPGRLQLLLTAATRAMRGIPGPHMPSVFQPKAVMMTHDRRTVSTLGPVAASCVSTRGRKPTGWIRARQDVMHVHRIPAPTYSVSLFGQCRLFRDVDGIRMQIVNVLRDHDPLRVIPGAVTNPVARIYARIAAWKRCA